MTFNFSGLNLSSMSNVSHRIDNNFNFDEFNVNDALFVNDFNIDTAKIDYSNNVLSNLNKIETSLEKGKYKGNFSVANYDKISGKELKALSILANLVEEGKIKLEKLPTDVAYKLVSLDVEVEKGDKKKGAGDANDIKTMFEKFSGGKKKVQKEEVVDFVYGKSSAERKQFFKQGLELVQNETELGQEKNKIKDKIQKLKNKDSEKAKNKIKELKGDLKDNKLKDLMNQRDQAELVGDTKTVKSLDSRIEKQNNKLISEQRYDTSRVHTRQGFEFVRGLEIIVDPEGVENACGQGATGCHTWNGRILVNSSDADGDAVHESWHARADLGPSRLNELVAYCLDKIISGEFDYIRQNPDFAIQVIEGAYSSGLVSREGNVDAVRNELIEIAPDLPELQEVLSIVNRAAARW